jgi:peptidoglycan hydrolase CwlO-like protein
MKRLRSCHFRLRLAVVVGASALAAGANLGAPARAGVWDDLRERVGALMGSKSTKREQALQARQKAQALDAKAAAARSQLVSAQRSLLEANQSYSRVWSQVKRTEANIIRERHRRFLITERYNRRRILFGRRLAAMQRSGSLDYMQIFLGSRTLSDLTRRAYLFRALMERDADLQSQLRADKSEIDKLTNDLASQWSRRNALRQDAYRERQRIAKATKSQQSELSRLVSSRNALQAFAAQRVGEMKELNQAVYDYNARAQAQAIAQAREEEAEQREAARREAEAEEARSETRSMRRRYRYASDEDDRATPTRSRARSSYNWSRRSSRSYARRDEDSSASTYTSSSGSRRRWRRSRSSRVAREEAPRMVRVRVAERVDRVRRVPTLGGRLSPMSIPEIVFKEKSVPISSGGGLNSGTSSSGSGSPTVRSETRAVDDFPASDP